ncbi:MAG: MIP/aquaporin family protein [Rhodospirillales bacterium]|jgi:glycerol uptake facilitator-like aquaporin|nr:MIP/aquaporin family protein [Rhodospirillales bacterium]
MNETSLSRQCVAEFLGTAFLLIAVVGSGIMGEKLSGGNGAIALLANSIATGAALTVLILVFGPLSGAHFNPAVTLAFFLRKSIKPGPAGWFVLAQIFGALLGVGLAHIMFGEALFAPSATARNGTAQYVGEIIATFGLLGTILGCAMTRPGWVALAVGLYITGAYWFTSSTSFANPAVTLGRALTPTFSGIAPADAPGFIIAQLIGALIAVAVFAWLYPRKDP